MYINALKVCGLYPKKMSSFTQNAKWSNYNNVRSITIVVVALNFNWKLFVVVVEASLVDDEWFPIWIEIVLDHFSLTSDDETKHAERNRYLT